MREPRKKRNFPKTRRDDYIPAVEEGTRAVEAGYDDYGDYEETLAFLKVGKTLGGRRFK